MSAAVAAAVEAAAAVETAAEAMRAAIPPQPELITHGYSPAAIPKAIRLPILILGHRRKINGASGPADGRSTKRKESNHVPLKIDAL